MLIVTLAKNYRQCLYFNECFRKEEYTGRWKEYWHRYKDGYICQKHYASLIGNPNKPKGYWKKYKQDPIKKKEHGRRAVRFFDTKIFMKTNPRKGICIWCGRKNGDEFINAKGKPSKIKTQLHHIEYYIIFKWFATIEICNSCHYKETLRLIKLKT